MANTRAAATAKERTKGKKPPRQPKAHSPERSPEYEDPNALGSEGEAQALREEGGKLPAGAKDIARHLEIVRLLDWSKAKGEQTANPGKQRLAVVLQRRGNPAQSVCARCAADGGIFNSCVAAPVFRGAAFQRGSCANCIWEGKDRSCSLRGDNMPLDSASIRQFVGNGGSLRDAMAAEWGDESSDDEEYVDEMEREENNVEEETVVAPETFFGAFLPDRAFARVGECQRGPRCQFDGKELRFPIPRRVWEDAGLLLTARTDLAHFVAIVDARLFELGLGGDSDYLFWEKEARRIPALYKLPRGENTNFRILSSPHDTPPQASHAPRTRTHHDGGSPKAYAGPSRARPLQPSLMPLDPGAYSEGESSSTNRMTYPRYQRIRGDYRGREVYDENDENRPPYSGIHIAPQVPIGDYRGREVDSENDENRRPYSRVYTIPQTPIAEPHPIRPEHHDAVANFLVSADTPQGQSTEPEQDISEAQRDAMERVNAVVRAQAASAAAAQYTHSVVPARRGYPDEGEEGMKSGKRARTSLSED